MGHGLGMVSAWASTEPPSADTAKTSARLVAIVLRMVTHAGALCVTSR